MTRLIANIGTSDIAVRPQHSDYFLPIGFDRREPNLQQPDPSSPIEQAWQKRQQTLCEQLCPELGVTVRQNSYTQHSEFSFREFTEKLNHAYSTDPAAWHDRIRPGRLWGVLNTAISDFQIQQAHIFVTDQAKPHLQDTCYAFAILDRWFQHHYQTADTPLTLTAETLPQSLNPTDEDALLEYYYGFFSQISQELNRQGQKSSSLLISIRGGTPQMQTALRIQAMTAMVNFQATLTPQLSVETLLQGHPSPCQAGGYWKYTKSQKYQTIKTLLERWDFDGAIGLLTDWQRSLDHLVAKELADPDIRMGKDQVQQLIAALQVGLNGLNLDYGSMGFCLRKNPTMAIDSALDRELLDPNTGDLTCDKLLNLYTQCNLYSKPKLNQSANFLTRMSSFYEEVQLQMLRVLQAETFFQGSIAGWNLDHDALWAVDEGQTWGALDAKMREGKYTDRWCSHNFDRKPVLQIKNRLDKTKLLQVLFQQRGSTAQVQQAQEVFDLLAKLDYWASIRNEIIHQAEGPGFHIFDRLRKKDIHEFSHKTKKAKLACPMNQIVPTLAAICRSPLNLVSPHLQQKYLQPNSRKVYIYGQVRHWVYDQIAT